MKNDSFIDTINQLSDESLFKILTLERGLYKSKAIDHAETIFEQRGLTLNVFQQKSNTSKNDLISEVKNRLKYGESIDAIMNHFKVREIELSEDVLKDVNKKLRSENRIEITRKLVVYIVACILFIIACVFHITARSPYRIIMGIFFAILSTSMLTIIYRLLKRKTTNFSLDSVQVEK